MATVSSVRLLRLRSARSRVFLIPDALCSLKVMRNPAQFISDLTSRNSPIALAHLLSFSAWTPAVSISIRFGPQLLFEVSNRKGRDFVNARLKTDGFD